MSVGRSLCEYTEFIFEGGFCTQVADLSFPHRAVEREIDVQREGQNIRLLLMAHRIQDSDLKKYAELSDSKFFLVIEDDADDALLIKRAFKATESCGAFVCRNLSEAKAYLQGAGMYADRNRYPFPNGVICDMHLGFESATDFLRWAKATVEFRSMPVIILTGTASTREAAAALELGARDVLRKPSRYEELRGMIQDMAAKLCG